MYARIVGVKFPDRPIVTPASCAALTRGMRTGAGGWASMKFCCLFMESVVVVAGRLPSRLVASRVVGVDQGEVAPLFSVWMRDKRNRGCFGQTLFGHGQPAYKHARRPSPRFTWRCAPPFVSPPSPSFLLSFSLFSSRFLFHRCSSTSSFTTLSFSRLRALCAMYLHACTNCALVSFVPYERHSNILYWWPGKKMLWLARSCHSRGDT